MKKEDTDKGKGKFAMRISGMTAILAILCLFSVQSVSAVQVSENVEFQTSGTNTAFIMGKDFNFDEIEVHPTYLKLDDATISVSPSAGSIDFTLFNLSTEYWKWNESCSNPGATTDHTMGGLNPNTHYLVKVNGATYGQYTSNSSGYASFRYTGGYSDIVFEMGLTKRCLGDLNGDGFVNFADVLVIVANWGPCPPAGCPPGGPTADLNGDGFVNSADVRVIVANWGPC